MAEECFKIDGVAIAAPETYKPVFSTTSTKSTKRDVSAGYISWGHSIVTDPWGRVIDMLDEKKGILLAELDMDYEEQVREELPLLKSRRKDMYKLEKLCK